MPLYQTAIQTFLSSAASEAGLEYAFRIPVVESILLLVPNIFGWGCADKENGHNDCFALTKRALRLTRMMRTGSGYLRGRSRFLSAEIMLAALDKFRTHTPNWSLLARSIPAGPRSANTSPEKKPRVDARPQDSYRRGWLRCTIGSCERASPEALRGA